MVTIKNECGGKHANAGQDGLIQNLGNETVYKAQPTSQPSFQPSEADGYAEALQKLNNILPTTQGRSNPGSRDHFGDVNMVFANPPTIWVPSLHDEKTQQYCQDTTPGVVNRVGQHRLQDYQVQLLMLEMHKKRLAEAERIKSEDQGQKGFATGATGNFINFQLELPEERDSHPPPQDYQTQLLMLEHQNKKRLIESRQATAGSIKSEDRGQEGFTAGPTGIFENYGLERQRGKNQLSEDRNMRPLNSSFKSLKITTEPEVGFSAKEGAAINNDHHLQDYTAQVQRLKQPNAQRIILALGKRSAEMMDSDDSSTENGDDYSEAEYETQLRLLEETDERRHKMQAASMLIPSQFGLRMLRDKIPISSRK